MQRDRLPVSVQNLIRGNVIRLSAASDFYKKRAEVATLLHDFVEPQPSCCYRLKNGFDSFFFGCLPVMLQAHRIGPADALADALFVLGREWAKEDYGRLPPTSLPTDEFLTNQWKGADAWEAFLQTDGCIGEIWWRNLGVDGNVSVWLGGCNPGDYELRIDFSPETTKPPTTALHIRGEPAAVLMNWWMTLHPNSPQQRHPAIEALRTRAESVLDSVMKQLKVDLKLTRLAKGRPRLDFGERAAYLLDHEKRSLAFIAKQLFRMPGDANASVRRQCFDRVRKAAKNYYKLLRSDYTSLTKRRVRQRIIRIPGNPKAVKSE